MIGTLLALPAAVWWIIGDQTDSSIAGDSLDHMLEPLPLSGNVELGVGVAAVAVVVACSVVLVVRAHRQAWDRLWLGPLAAAASAAVITGYGCRVVTAGVIGANIGAGLAFFVIPPLVLILLVTAVVLAVRLRPGVSWPNRSASSSTSSSGSRATISRAGEARSSSSRSGRLTS